MSLKENVSFCNVLFEMVWQNKDVYTLQGTLRLNTAVSWALVEVDAIFFIIYIYYVYLYTYRYKYDKYY